MSFITAEIFAERLQSLIDERQQLARAMADVDGRLASIAQLLAADVVRPAEVQPRAAARKPGRPPARPASYKDNADGPMQTQSIPEAPQAERDAELLTDTKSEAVGPGGRGVEPPVGTEDFQQPCVADLPESGEEARQGTERSRTGLTVATHDARPRREAWGVSESPNPINRNGRGPSFPRQAEDNTPTIASVLDSGRRGDKSDPAAIAGSPRSRRRKPNPEPKFHQGDRVRLGPAARNHPGRAGVVCAEPQGLVYVSVKLDGLGYARQIPAAVLELEGGAAPERRVEFRPSGFAEAVGAGSED